MAIITWEMQIKTTVCYYFTPIRILFEKDREIKRTGMNVAKRNLCILMGM